MNEKILIIDDEATFRNSLQAGLEDAGYLVDAAGDGQSGLELISKKGHELVLLDIRLPGKNGIELLKEIKIKFPDIVVILLTAYGDTKSTVKAIKEGAFDYLNKPVDLDELKKCLDKALATRRSSQIPVSFYKKHDTVENIEIIGNSPAIKEVNNKIATVAKYNDTTVLIYGETGTGKELVAKAIHHYSKRRNKPFLDINCAAIPRDLLESELFGFEKSAFTGASSTKKGLLEMANGGTLFLDEIGELSPDLQSKLLRFLEDKKFKRIGGLDDIHVNVRVIAATNQDLESEIARGNFRKDLYYRLNVFPINLPPLRERNNDVVLIAYHFLQQLNKQLGKNFTGFSAETENIIKKYPWPGNVRELKNVIERILILNDVKWISPGELPDALRSASKSSAGAELSAPENPEADTISAGPGRDIKPVAAVNARNKTGIDEPCQVEQFSLERELQSIERTYLEKALHETRWNVSRAAEMLGISRFALQRRIEKYFKKEQP